MRHSSRKIEWRIHFDDTHAKFDPICKLLTREQSQIDVDEAISRYCYNNRIKADGEVRADPPFSRQPRQVK